MYCWQSIYFDKNRDENRVGQKGQECLESQIRDQSKFLKFVH